MRTLRLVLLCWLVLVVQTTLIPSLRFRGAGPDLALLLVIYLGFFHGIEAAAATGFLLGLALDALSLSPLGLNAFTKAACGCLAGLLSVRLFPENRLLQVLAAAVAAVFQEVIFLISSRLLLNVASPAVHPLLGPLSQAVWSGALAVLVLPLFHSMIGRAPIREAFRASESIEF